MKPIIIIFLTLIVLGLATGCQAKTGANPVRTVANVVLERYLGVWYQQSFSPSAGRKPIVASW